MTLYEEIRADMKKAMKEKDEPKLSVLRGILSEFTNANVAAGRKPTDEIPPEEALKVVERAAKQRKDSILSFEKGGRDDLAKDEKEELKIIERYLPEQLSDEEIRKVVKGKIEEMSIEDKSGMGQLMGAVMKEIQGKADGLRVKKIVEEEL